MQETQTTVPGLVSAQMSAEISKDTIAKHIAILRESNNAAGITDVDRKTWETRAMVRTIVTNCRDSLNRIHQALETAESRDTAPLLKADLVNAARHCVELTKNIRAIQKTIFPVEPKAPTGTNGTTETKTQ